MPRYNLNDPHVRQLAEQAEKGFQLLPEGPHLMRCRDCGFAIVNDKPALRLDLEVERGEPHELSPCRDTLFFSDRAIGRALLALNAFGLKDTDLGAFDPEDAACRAKIIGRKAIVTVQHQLNKKDNKTYANPTYNGYAVPHDGAIADMHRKQQSGPAGSSPAPGGGGQAAGPVDYGNVPF